jgi:hypothetical protein
MKSQTEHINIHNFHLISEIFTTFDMIAKKKKIKNLEVVKEYINKKIEELNK